MPVSIVLSVVPSAVDKAYGKSGFKSDAERVAFLFDLYRQYTSLLPADDKLKRGKRAKSK